MDVEGIAVHHMWKRSLEIPLKRNSNKDLRQPKLQALKLRLELAIRAEIETSVTVGRPTSPLFEPIREALAFVCEELGEWSFALPGE